MNSKMLSIRLLASFIIGYLCMINSDDNCKWDKPSNAPNIYWINMDKSVDRRAAMEKHLNDVVGADKHFRVRGITLGDIYIPADIEKSWGSNAAKYDTSEEIPHRSQVTETAFAHLITVHFHSRVRVRVGIEGGSLLDLF